MHNESAASPSPSSWGRSVKTVVGKVANVNHFVNKSTFGRVFRLKDCGHVSWTCSPGV